MQTENDAIQIVNCHAAGEVGDVIVAGVEPPLADSIWDQSRIIANDQTLRNFVLNEPRGNLAKHVNLLVPPKTKQQTSASLSWNPKTPHQCPGQIRFALQPLYWRPVGQSD